MKKKRNPVAVWLIANYPWIKWAGVGVMVVMVYNAMRAQQGGTMGNPEGYRVELDADGAIDMVASQFGVPLAARGVLKRGIGEMARRLSAMYNDGRGQQN